MKIIKIDGDWADVQSADHGHRVNISLVGDAKVGDYVLAHSDMAINKVDNGEAERILNMIGSLNHHKKEV